MTALIMPLNTPLPDPEFGGSTVITALGTHPTPTQLTEFWETAGAHSPIIEADRPGYSRVTFIWRGDATAVYVALNRVTSTLEHAALHRLWGTDLWHRTFVMPDTWRSSYTMLAPNDEQLATLREATPRWAMRLIREAGHPDPRNPHTLHAHAGPMSEVALAGAHRSELLDPNLAFTGVSTTEVRTPTGRRAWLLEPFTGSDTPRPLIILLDGEVWHANGAVAQVLSSLGPAAPTALLLEATPGDRVTDYGPESPLPDEIVESILPWIRSIAPISEHAADITVSGESLGGLTALRTAFAHPQHLSNVIAQSSSLWATDLVPHVPPAAPALHLTLTVGCYETLMLTQHHELHTALRDTGHRVAFSEFTGGHDMAWWVQLWAESMRTNYQHVTQQIL